MTTVHACGKSYNSKCRIVFRSTKLMSEKIVRVAVLDIYIKIRVS